MSSRYEFLARLSVLHLLCVAICVMYLFLMVMCVGLQSVIVEFFVHYMVGSKKKLSKGSNS